MTPTQQTMKHLRDNGYLALLVEHRPAHGRGRTTRDFAGILDVIAFKGAETLGVQATSAGNLAARVTKMRQSPNLPYLLAAGWRIVAWGWRDDGTLREVELGADEQDAA